MSNKEIFRRESQNPFWPKTCPSIKVHSVCLSHRKLLKTEMRAVFLLTSRDRDLLRTQKFLDPFSLTVIQQLSMVYSTMDTYIFLSLKADFEIMHLKKCSSPATFTLTPCTLATHINFVFLEHHKFIFSLRPLHHPSVCLECSSLLSLPGWFFILILDLAQISLSTQSLTSFYPVTLFFSRGLQTMSWGPEVAINLVSCGLRAKHGFYAFLSG